MSEYLTTTDICKILCFTRTYVIQLIKDGKLKAIKIGGNYRIKEEDLKEYQRGEEGVYKLSKISEELKVSAQTLRNWIKNGTLKAVKIGGEWRVTDEEFERLKRGE